MPQNISSNFPNIKFSNPNMEAWLEVAKNELNGADPIKELTITKGTLKIKPYYQSIPEVNQHDFSLLPSVNPYYGPRCWLNIPRILILNEKQANQEALQSLANGADGILFEPSKSNIQFDTLLDQIKTEFCTLSWIVRNEYADSISAFDLWIRKNEIRKSLSGTVFWKESPKAEFDHLLACQVSPFGILVKTKSNAEDEIADTLLNTIATIESLIKQKISIDVAIRGIAFSISIGTDFFMEIAKIKSLRNLWYQIQMAYGIAAVHPVHIHATSKAWLDERYQPHGNMIKSTTSAIAAILGGCDSLTIEPEAEQEMMNRIARNVSSILRDESYLSKVADPTAGSYYLDSLTADLSEKAWQKFQSKV
jgi:methylmalonyl-CoA mutase